MIYAEDGYALAKVEGFAYAGWCNRIYHTRASEDVLLIELTVPESCEGTLRLFILDPDLFMGGRKQEIRVDGETLGTYQDFQRGEWIEVSLTAAITEDGRVRIEAQNLRKQGNAVISIVECRAK